jgi:hypothetical protein
MGRIALFREQASLLRAIAGTFDARTVRAELLELAARCDELAADIEKDEPIAEAAPALPE